MRILEMRYLCRAGRTCLTMGMIGSTGSDGRLGLLSGVGPKEVYFEVFQFWILTMTLSDSLELVPERLYHLKSRFSS